MKAILIRPTPFIINAKKSSSPLIEGKLTEFELGFIVGVIESEGSIGFTLSRAGHSKFPAPFISITNTDIKLLEKAHSLIGGSICLRRRQTKEHLPIYGLVVSQVYTVYETLKAVMPFLIGKRQDAKLVVEWCDLRLNRPRLSKPTPGEIQIVKQQWERRANRYKRFLKTRSVYLEQLEGGSNA